MPNYNIDISITDGEGKKTSIQKSKSYEEVSYINKEFDNSDSFDTLVEFDWDGVNSNFRDCKGILIQNNGPTSAELQFVMEDWTAGAADSNGADGYNNTYLASGECLYLPHNRIVGYNGATSAGGGTTNQFSDTQDITSGLVSSGTLINMGSGTTAGDASGLHALTVDTIDANQFEPGDVLLLGILENDVATEAIEVVTVDSATQITVKRGVLGTTPVAHADDQPLYWYWGNLDVPIKEIMGTGLAFVAAAAGTSETITDTGSGFLTANFQAGDIVRIEDNGAANDGAYEQIANVTAGTLSLHENCSLTSVSAGTSFKVTTIPVHTSSRGTFKTSNWFGKFRNANADDRFQGIVPGSVMIQFCNPASALIPVGVSVSSASDTNLTAATTYRWAIILDGWEANLTTTIDSTNTKFGGVNGLINKLQQTIDDAVVAGTFPFGASVSLVDGHIKIQSKTNIGNYNGNLTDSENNNFSRGSSQVIIKDSTTGSETQLLGAGRIGKSYIENYPRFPDLATKSYDGKVVANTAEMMIDHGDGTISGQGAVGTIDYNSGAINITNAPPFAQMRVSATGASALAGGVMRTDAASSNCIEKISARSMNPHSNTKIKCTIFS